MFLTVFFQISALFSKIFMHFLIFDVVQNVDANLNFAENMKQSLKKDENSNSDNRFWCWRMSSKIILTYFWNATY